MLAVDNVTIAVPEDDAGERLSDLYRWLRDDPDVGATITHVSVRPLPEEMGGSAGSVLIAALASKELLVALVSGLTGWLVARAPLRRTKVHVKHGDREIEIDSASISDPEAATLRILQELVETQSGAAS